jgi:hypothetical protein
MLSGTFIRADLRLPGAFGDLLGESFRLFALLEERKTIFKRRHIIEGIDDLLLELDRGGTEKNSGLYGIRPGPEQRHPASLPLLAAIILAAALLSLADEGAVLTWVENFITAPGPGPAPRWLPNNPG